MTRDVRVRFVAEDEATETARLLLDTLRRLQREERAATQETRQAARQAREAADGFRRMAAGISGLRATGGLDAISRRVQLLSEGLRHASTRAQALTRLTAIEGQLQRALGRTNLSLSDRIRLERTLQQTQVALAGRAGVGGAAGGVAAGGTLAGLAAGARQVQGALAAMGIALSGVQFVRFIGGALEAADALDELSERTGVAVETLSVLRTLPELSDAGGLQGLGDAFRRLARAIEQAQQGASGAREAFETLGITVEDLRALSIEQVFFRIAAAQSRFADGAGKTAILLRVLGRSGDDVLPLLNRLARDGFDRLRESAEASGAIISRDTARRIAAFKDRVQELHLALEGLAATAAVDLLPQLTAMVERVRELTVRFREWRDEIPQGVRSLSGAIATLAARFGGLPVQTARSNVALEDFLRRLVGLRTSAEEAQEALRNLPRLPDVTVTRPPRPQPQIRDQAEVRALRNAELAAIRDHARDVLALERALIQQREAITESAFHRGVTDLTQFYAARLQAVQDGIAAERAALEAERDALRGAPLSEDTEAARVQRKRELAALEAQIARLAVDGQTRVLQLLEQERQARQALAASARQLSVELLQAAGDEARASRIQIAEAARQAAETLRAVGGFTEEQITQIQTAFSTLLTDRAAFDRLNAQAQREQAALARDRAAIEEQARLGLISQRDAQLQIAALERGRLPSLQRLVDLMRAFAEEIGDPALTATVDDLAASFRGMGTVVNEVQVRVANLSTELVGGVQQTLSQFLGSTINQAKTGLDALRLLAQGLAATFQRIFADIVAAQIVRSIFGSGDELTRSAGALTASAGALSGAGGILTGAAAALQAAAAALAAAMAAGALPVPGFATGGYVRGSGTGTSDSILARLSAGEFVVRAAVVQQPGMRELLTALNGFTPRRLRSLDRYGVPRFAEGGLVVSGPPPAAAPVTNRLEIDVAHSEDTIVRVLDRSPGVAKAVLRLVQKNRGAFRSVLA